MAWAERLRALQRSLRVAKGDNHDPQIPISKKVLILCCFIINLLYILQISFHVNKYVNTSGFPLVHSLKQNQANITVN